MSDLILYNARIHTMEAAHPTAHAIAIRDNQIVAVGDESFMLRMLPHAQKIDLHDRCVIPGLIDAHLHAEWTALGLKNVDAETPTLDEVLRRVEEFAQKTPQGEWIRGHGWNQNVWGGSVPDKGRSRSGCAGASRLSHRQERTRRVGQFARVEDGGHHVEHRRIRSAVRSCAKPTAIPPASSSKTRCSWSARSSPNPPRNKWPMRMRDALPLFHRVGLTGVHDFDGARALQAWQILKENGELNFRVSKTIPVALLDHAIALGIRSGFGDDRLRINSVKAFADGALGPQTALMIDPYERQQRQSRHQHAGQRRDVRECAQGQRGGVVVHHSRHRR